MARPRRAVARAQRLQRARLHPCARSISPTAGPQFPVRLEALAPATRGALLRSAQWPPAPRQGDAIAAIWTHKQATPQRRFSTAGAPAGAGRDPRSFRRTAPDVAGLMFPLLPLDGPTAALLRERAAGGALRVVDPGQRAVLSHGPDPDTFLDMSMTPKRLSKLRRARGRLAAKSDVAVRIESGACAVRRATEDFLVLEVKGWKGKRGTALLSTPQLATFTRATLRALASQGACRIYSLDVDGVAIAMAVVLIGGDRAFIWKVAYDEAFAAFSPGVQLTLELTRSLLADDGIALTDSCAVANHPMIDHVWPQRIDHRRRLHRHRPESGEGVRRRHGPRRAVAQRPQPPEGRRLSVEGWKRS